jgi:ABC-2 type transport system permease protein
MRLTHVLNLGIKEMRGLARDPVLLFLMIYSFSLSIYTAATAISTRRRRPCRKR